MEESQRGSTKRIRKLIDAMDECAWKDRSQEWLTLKMFKDIGTKYCKEPVIIRRALAISEMLEAMADSENSQTTYTYEINDNELIVGVMALGSLGLGKAFPNYLTDDEKRVATITLKTEMALFGHNTVNYERLLKYGLKKIIDECDSNIALIEDKVKHHDIVIDFCQNFEKKPEYVDDKSSETKNSVGAIFEQEDEKRGNRLKMYDKEIGILFNQLNVNLGTIKDRTAEVDHKECQDRNRHIVVKITEKTVDKRGLLQSRMDFYKAVKISCNGVIAYAKKYAALAKEKAKCEKNPERKRELEEIAGVCRKVPEQPAETFHEALQSIFFFHLSLHSAMNQLSIGRLDQVLQPYFKESEKDKQIELLECFLIKCAERLILDSQTFVKQDHVDFASDLLTIPVSLDQWAEANEFLQNIIIGGQTRDGNDATNDCSYLILEAYKNTKLYTPTLNARIHKNQCTDDPNYDKFLKKIAECLLTTKNGTPVIGNDEVLVTAMSKYSGIPEEEALDYVIDGCWEPLLNGTCDWTFRMLNLLTVLECSLNEGATLSSNPILLRGEKLCYRTPVPDTFEILKQNMIEHIRFFTDQAALSIYKLYLIDQAINPTPLYSALLEGCMKNGRDKTWGGANYRLAGIIAAGVPDTVNTLAAVKKWIYDEKTFIVSDILDAFRYSYDASGDDEKQKTYDRIKVKFQSESPKFGNNEEQVNEIMQWLLNTLYECIQKSKKMAEEVFLKKPSSQDEKRIIGLRLLANYSGKSMEEEFGEGFDIKFTAGLGTFELFNLMGLGNAASVDRDKAGDPLARNFAPMVGTTKYHIGHLLSSFKDFGLDRFAGGAITDLCVEEKDLDKNDEKAVEQLRAIIKYFVESNGNMMTLTISDRALLERIHNLCESAKSGDETALIELKKYDRVSVRVAGFQAPFITLPKQHQESYILRPISPLG